MKIEAFLTLDMIPIAIKYAAGTGRKLELFLVHRSTPDRVGYSIGYVDLLSLDDDVQEIHCTSYIWTDKRKALMKLVDIVADNDDVVVSVC